MTPVYEVKKGDRIVVPRRMPHVEQALVIRRGEVCEVFDSYPAVGDKRWRLTIKHPKTGKLRSTLYRTDMTLEVNP